MASILSIISLVSFILAGVSLILTILFWFLFNIPAVIGDLTGRTARKSIAKLRAGNERSGAKSYRSSTTNVNRGKLTSNMPETDDSLKKTKKDNAETDMLVGNMADATGSMETELLTAGATETTALLDDDNATVSLVEDEFETTSLTDDENETTMLEPQVEETTYRKGNKQLVMLDEVMLIHTDEVIG